MSEIRNKVQEAGLIQLDPSIWLRNKSFETLDVSEWLHMGLVLKEKDFRTHLENFTPKADVIYGLIFPSDALVQNWAYMLVQAHFNSHNNEVFICKNDKHLKGLYIEHHLPEIIAGEELDDKRVLIKGCADVTLSPQFFTHITELLSKEVKSLMFGEACSAVPVFKAKR